VARVGWTPQSLADLEAICLFIARDAPAMAGIFADRVFRASDRLAEHPRSGRIVPELGQEHLREILLGSYRIIYRLLDEDVQVLTVHHGARLLDIGTLGEGR
jgi:plasmid stabilization system protein ParE